MSLEFRRSEAEMPGFELGAQLKKALPEIITIDGPSASGKSTVSRLLASKLGYRWVSTGIFYRGIGYLVSVLNIDPANEQAIVEMISTHPWRVQLDPDKTRFFHENQDVTEQLQKEEVGFLASQISQFPKVRAALLQAQRECADIQGLIAEGRDCGTVVFPQAGLKIYLTASEDQRFHRRAKEEGVSEESLVEKQRARDHADQSRKTAPLQVPDDGVVVDTSEMTLEEVVDGLFKRLHD